MNAEILQDVRRLRHALHETPELAFQEYKTKSVLMDYLKKLPRVEVIDRGSWFYAKAEGTDPSTEALAFRADFDAVAGKDGRPGHFCGHDGHAAILAGFARYLSENPPRENVFMIFQPAEEIGEGARLCRSLFREADIRAIYGFHNIPGYPEGSVLLLPGTFACASTSLEITVEGKPSHAAYPEAGKNPAGVIAQLILWKDELLAMPHRGLILATVIGVEIGSAAYGVSAGQGILRLTIRGELEEEFRALVSAFTRKAEELSTDEDMRCSVKQIEEFPATTNPPEGVKTIVAAAQAAGAEFIYPKEPFRWSEDFGYYLQDVPGAFFGIGAGVDWPQLHTEEYEFPDEIIEQVLNMYIQLSVL